MARDRAARISDEIVHLIFPYLPTSSLLAFIQVSKTAYNIAVDSRTDTSTRLREFPGNQLVLKTFGNQDLVAVLRQRARFHLFETNSWCNATDLKINHSVGGFTLDPKDAISSDCKKVTVSPPRKSTIDIDNATIATVSDEAHNLRSFVIFIAAGARNASIYEVRDQIIRHLYTIPDPFPYQKGIEVSIAKITTWENTEPGLSILYLHEHNQEQRWSATHFPLSSLEGQDRRRQHELGIESYCLSECKKKYDDTITTPLAITRASYNRCIIAWRHTFPRVAGDKNSGPRMVIHLRGYKPDPTSPRQTGAYANLLRYTEFDASPQRSQINAHLKSEVDPTLRNICDLDITEDLNANDEGADEEVNMQIYSHGALLQRVRVFNVFGQSDSIFGESDWEGPETSSFTVLPRDPSLVPSINISPLKLDNWIADFLIGPTIAVVSLPNDRPGCLQIVSPDGSPDENVFLSGSFFYMDGGDQQPYTKLLVNLLEWPGRETIRGLSGRAISAYYDDKKDRHTCRIAVADGEGVRIWSILLGFFVKTSFETHPPAKQLGDFEDDEIASQYVKKKPAAAEDAGGPSNEIKTYMDDGESYTRHYHQPKNKDFIRSSDYPDRFRYDQFDMREYNVVGLHPTRLDAGGVVQQLQLTRNELLVLTNRGVRHWNFGRDAIGMKKGFKFENDDGSDDENEGEKEE